MTEHELRKQAHRERLRDEFAAAALTGSATPHTLVKVSCPHCDTLLDALL